FIGYSSAGAGLSPAFPLAAVVLLQWPRPAARRRRRGGADPVGFPNQEKAMFANPFSRCVRRPAVPALLLAAVLVNSAPSPGKGAPQPDFIPPGYDDYQNMLGQLGIQKMRKGRDARVKDTSDEATASPYETMPDLMTFKDGTKVTSADQWPRRRAEIVEDFE